jgi:hypothetical protein
LPTGPREPKSAVLSGKDEAILVAVRRHTPLPRRARLIDRMELQLEECDADTTEDGIAVERLAAKIINVSAFGRRRPAPKAASGHLPRGS